MERTVDYASLAAFVAKRRKATGGYGATRQLPATVEDTFEAVELLGIISGRAPVELLPENDPELADYLARVQAAPWLGLATTYQLLVTCRRLGLALDADRIRDYAVAALSRAPSLATTYYVARLAGEVLGERPGSLLGREPLLELPARCTVDHVCMQVAVCAALGRPLAAAELIPWLQRAQNGDGGFGFFPGTISFIENSHAALAALALLGARPTAPAAARAFILSCQTGAGGFGRSSRAAPFLDASWHAIRSLQALESLA